MNLSLILRVTCVAAACAHGLVHAQSQPSPALQPVDIPGLVTFWSFQEPAGTPRVSSGRFRYELAEMNGPVKRVEDGIFGPYSADLEWGQWFRVKRKDAPGLNLHGPRQPVSMVAWIKRESDRQWQFIAGMWNEGDRKFIGKAQAQGARAPARQYAMFTSGIWQNDWKTYRRKPAEHQVMGYISPFGGATQGHPFAFDYATGGTRLEQDRWYMLCFTYDLKMIRVYVDGRLDVNANCNPFVYTGPIYDGGEPGADFTVAHRNHPQWPAYPEGLPKHQEGFDGRMAGLAVYDRALTDDEIAGLFHATMKK